MLSEILNLYLCTDVVSGENMNLKQNTLLVFMIGICLPTWVSANEKLAKTQEYCQEHAVSSREEGEIRHYFQTNNRVELAKWIRYPIRIETKDPRVSAIDSRYNHLGEEFNILNEQEFVIFYQRFITTKVLNLEKGISHFNLGDGEERVTFINGLPFRKKLTVFQKKYCKNVKLPLWNFRVVYDEQPGVVKSNAGELE